MSFTDTCLNIITLTIATNGRNPNNKKIYIYTITYVDNISKKPNIISDKVYSN